MAEKYGAAMRLKLSEIILLLLLMFGLCMPTNTYSAQQDETQVKAVFVLNFAKLTEWPADSSVDSGTFTIAILGKVPSTLFITTLQSQTIHGAKVNVRLIETVAAAKGAHLVYISGSERKHLSGILRELNQLNILTVSDITGFCAAGGMVGLVPVQNRLGFEINLASVRKTKLNVSSQLLKLAKTIFGN